MFYAQQGEDEFLYNRLWANSPGGTFVDIGAHDGVEISNTYFFESVMDWTGICVEPHPIVYQSLIRNRRSLCVRAQVGSTCELDAEFWITNRGGCSSSDGTFREKTIAWYSETAFEGWRETRVPRLTLDMILATLWVDKPITLLSIDVEGTELNVLAGFTLDRWQPRVVVIEVMDTEAEARDIVDPYFAKVGYQRSGKFSSNLIYCRDNEDKDKLAA